MKIKTKAQIQLEKYMKEKGVKPGQGKKKKARKLQKGKDE